MHISPDSLLPWVSPQLVRSLEEGRGLQDFERPFSAAAALIDVVGFTRRAETLAALGDQAPEALSDLVNSTFGPLVGRIEDCGGEILRFPGDAMIVLWPVGRDGLGGAVQRAAACCLELVGDQRGSALPLSCGIAAGPLTTGTVGGVLGRMEHVVLGEALREMGVAQSHADRSEVVLAPSAWDCPGTSLSLDPIEGGDFRRLRHAAPPPWTPRLLGGVPSPGLSHDVRGYLPRALIKRLEAWGEHWLSELRPVSVLFVRLAEQDDPAPMPLARIHTTLCSLQRVVYRYEGAIDKLCVDDKGLTVLAAMGLPPLAHEDDPLRALLAAQRIQAELRASGVRADIGVATGRAICGPIGGPNRREYSMLGRVVNRAARLMQAGEGILCDAATAQAAGTVGLDDLGGRPLKGIDQPVRVFAPAAQSPVEPAPTPQPAPSVAVRLVGRQAERQTLDAMLAGLRDGLGGAALLTGGAGIGKSRLVQDFVDRARSSGAEVWTIQPDPHARHVPFGAVAPLYRTLLHDADVRRIAALSPDRAALLDSITGLALGPPELSPPVEGDARRESIIDALLEITEAAMAEWPVLQILVVEEVHGLDSASLAWLERLLARMHLLGCGVVMTSRFPVRSDPRALRLLAWDRTELVAVQPLSDPDVGELLLDLLGCEELDPALRALVTSRAGGNPLFCRELIADLLRRGLIERDGHGRALLLDHRQASERLPASLIVALGAQLDRLDVDVQLTLKAASVLGPVFDADLLQAIHPSCPTADELLSQLDGLRQDQLLVVEPSRRGLRHRFRHAALHQATYERLPVARRQELHGAALAVLEPRVDTPPALLAHHAWAADHTLEGLAWTGPAARAAAQAGSFREVTALLEPRVSLLQPGDPRLASWRLLLGQAAVAVGDHDRARVHLHAALRAVGRPVPAGILGFGVAIGRECTLQLWRRLWGRIPGGSASARVAAQAHEELGYVHYASGETLEGVHAAVAMLNLWDQIGPSAGLVRARASAALAMAILGLHRLSGWYEATAFAIAAGLDRPRPLAYAAWVAAICAAGRAEWERFEVLGDQAWTASERMGDRWLSAAILQTLAAAYVLRGDTERATEAALQQLQLAEEHQNLLWEAWACNALGEVSLLEGDPSLALRQAEKALAHLERVADPTEQVRALAVVTRAHLRLGHTIAAGDAAERTRQGLATTGPTAFYLAGAMDALVEAAPTARVRARARRQRARFARTFPVACTGPGQTDRFPWGSFDSAAAPEDHAVRGRIL